MAKLGFCGACATETATSRREAGFHMDFFGLKTLTWKLRCSDENGEDKEHKGKKTNQRRRRRKP